MVFFFIGAVKRSCKFVTVALVQICVLRTNCCDLSGDSRSSETNLVRRGVLEANTLAQIGD